MNGNAQKRELRPERVLAWGFLALIALGTLLLVLPVAASTGESIGLYESLFTATSAVCVTGLMLLDTAGAFSLFGQVVLLVLVQLGGLGFMIFATLIMAAMGRRITLRSRVLIRESMSTGTMSGLTALAGWYGLMSLLFEFAGAVLLALRFVPMMGWGKGLFYSVFHSVSAFCNAGFDLMGGFASLASFRGDALVLLTVSVLVILGGLGFAVILEIVNGRGRWKLFSLQAKIVLASSGVLLVLGTVFFALAEWNNPATLDAEGASAGDKLLDALFLSVTMRTAGFSTVSFAEMTGASKLMSLILMFIGASPASTGGGVKTTTISVLVLAVISVVRGQEQVNAFGRRLSEELLRRALALVMITLTLLVLCATGLSLLEADKPVIDVLFDTTGALTTVGAAAIGPAGMNRLSQALLIPMMFFARIGPLTMAMALAGRKDKGRNKLKFPEEKMLIG